MDKTLPGRYSPSQAMILILQSQHLQLFCLEVSIAWLLLKMTFDPVTAQLLPKPRCPTCREGYFVKKSCSVITTNNEVKTEGVQCQLCTDCSAADQDTLVKCSTFADSLCGDKSSPAVTPTLTATEPPELFLSSCFCCSVCFSSCWSAGTADAPSREVTSSKVRIPCD
ncbi:uncharacterized protein LOC143317287 [Chaetodon auriga]|uniref:uncharacterized protein LOC143317287 n=1 Tax=Chaetodon auriga TaxID=39042 RepID=UPI004032F4F1